MFHRIVSLSSCLFVSGLLVAGGCNGNAPSKKPHVAYVTNGVASFWVIAEKGAKVIVADLTDSQPEEVAVGVSVDGQDQPMRLVDTR